MEKVAKLLRDLLGDRFRENYPLKNYTTFKTGGCAKFIVFPKDIEEVKKIMEISKNSSIPLLILGGGSNLLVSDKGFEGIALSTFSLKKVLSAGKTLTIESGTKISHLMKYMVKENIGGLEFLAGIPGTVGGAVIMNAGLKKIWISEKIISVEVVNSKNLNILQIPAEKINFGYRKSGLENFFLWRTTFQLEKKEEKKIKKTIASYIRDKIKTQPVFSYSAGSVFKNPPGKFAGVLIENCGLKSYKTGDAQISEKHANFIINCGNSSSTEIYRLMKFVQNEVLKKYNIKLEPEIKLAGEF